MKKCILFAAVLFVLTGCSHSDGINSPDLSSSVIPEFKKLTIDYGQAVSPQWVNETIVIKSTPQIEKIVTSGSWGEDAESVELNVVCTAVVPLKQDEYDEILQLIVAADIEAYAPAENCEELVGSTGITVDYVKTDGANHGFHTLCDLEAEIDALVKGVEDLANEIIPDCDRTMAEFSSGEEAPDVEVPEAATGEASEEYRAYRGPLRRFGK